MFKNIFNKFANKSEAVKVITILNSYQFTYYSANELSGREVYEEIKAKTPAERKAFIMELLTFVGSLKKTDNHYYPSRTSYTVLFALLRSNLSYTEEEWMQLFTKFLAIHNDKKSVTSLDDFPLNYAIQQLERYVKKNEPSEDLMAFLKETLASNVFTSQQAVQYYGSDLNKAKMKLVAILGDNGETTSFSLHDSDIGPLVNQIIAEITTHKEDFNELFLLASDASQSKPTKKFKDKTTVHINAIGADTYRKVAQDILKTTFAVQIEQVSEWYATYLSSPHQQFIKGIVWTMERFSDKETIQILSKLFQKGYEKIPGQGPAAASIGNACAYTLGNMRGKDGLGALSRIKLKLKQNNIKKIIDKYLLEGAKKYNVSVEELKEMAVPSFHLENGTKTIAFDDYSLTILLEGTKVLQQWSKPDGSQMKSVPSVVKNSASLTKKLKEVRKEIKEIQKVYSAQKQRIDNQFILDRTWDFASFEKFYLNHGLVYPITKQLIWNFTKGNQSVNAILLDDKWYSVHHDHINWIDQDTHVKLWHPVIAEEAEIIAWRDKMIDLEWKQPIKQAFREIYILTDAELNTRTYSNRMAAHILKQHQFSTLASLRGWKYSLLGAYDDGRDGEVCQKHIPEHKMTAEYWIDEMYQDDAFNDAGIWFYVATDQVKFKDEDGNALELVAIPKIVFTEIMRDVDLFVGVASVGNDPQWIDNNGERQTHREYWHSYSFGNLTEIAKTRKTILERLLPRLTKIRDKAHIDGKFLIVKGQLRTYKIHIGSGNILMEPNDQYLCIVPSRSVENTTERIFIPFEGDKGLSIVLSKAFLLAEDQKIKDTTITSQINRK